MLKRFFFLLSFCLGFILSPSAQTKAPAKDDTAKEAAVFERLVTRLHYENDGTGFEEFTRAIRVQSEAGVEAYGQLVFGYSSATENLEVNYVRVRKPNGQVVETPPSNTQDLAPEVLRSAPMYSDYRQRHVTVSGLRPRDILEFQTTTRMHTPLAPGEFWYEYSFPRRIAVTEARLEVDIPKARDLRIKSPDRKYTTSESGDRRIYTWVVQNIVPKRPNPNDRTGRASDEEEEETPEWPDIQLTTFKDWQTVARWYAQLQAERVTVNDEIRKKADELTKGATTPLEKAHRLYDFVAKDIRYVSLSFGVGRFQPHAASEVLQGSYGDCKDKHTLLSSLLRAAGIQSYPVLIGSEQKLDEDVPSPAQFDHVITAAKIGKDLVWLDATAEVAPFGMLLYPLRDKQALLVADDATAGLHKTTAVSPYKNSMSISMDGKFSEAGAFDASVDMTATGDDAVPLRMAFRSTSEVDWQKLAEILSWSQGLRGKISDLDVTPFDDASKPFRLRYKYHDDSYFTVPTAGVDFNPFPPIGLIRLPRKKKNEPIDIGPIGEVHQRAHLQFPNNYTLNVPPEVRMTRDYGDYSSAFRFKNNVLDVERSLAIKMNQLPAARRSDIESMRNVLLGSGTQTLFCTIRPASKAASSSALADAALPAELRKAGLKALQERDYQTASALLKRAVEKEPTSADAWDDLGKAYLGLDNHSEALAAFQKQVEVNAYHKHAYNDLAAELQRQGKYEEAVSAYGKQLANSPVDNIARKNRGLLLAQLKRDKEALPELEAVATGPSGDPRVQLALAQLYAGSGNTEKSRDLLMVVLGTTTLPAGDPYSASLRDDVDPTKTIDDATKVLNDIGDQFDSGSYDEDSPEVFSTMHFVALEWARVGWAKFRKGETLEGMRYLEAAWTLSGSGTVANRLARVYQKALQAEKAKHFLALAVAAGGADAEDSRSRLAKLGASTAPAALAQSQAELLQIRTVKLPGMTGKKGEAEFTLVFDGSSKPERVEFRGGEASLRDAEQVLINATYPVMFPDRSSIKIVRRGTLTCTATGCAAALKPLESVQPSPLMLAGNKN